ncbi:MAG TPA: VWA domain-containing protein [Pyrinomonadaceae bacterium]|jgi:VWFA-related protein
MSLFNSSTARVFLSIALLCIFPCVLLAQEQTDDVVRINTELVQTDVMVFDKAGRLVEGLSPEEFDLTLDGKPQPISFFERIKTGSAQEAAQVTAARRGTRAEQSTKANASTTLNASTTTDNGRVILFFLDDVHLSGESLARARRALTEFVDKRMRQSDQVAIVSTSGQIGFLQQLTDNEAVLHEAIARLNYKRNPETYSGRTIITDYQANLLSEGSDSALFNYLVTSTINEFQLTATKGGDSRGLGQIAANSVKNRIRQIQGQSTADTANTLAVLMSLMRSSADLPGRKLVFFLSDGFITDARSNAMAMLKRVTETAARVGIVVYTMDVRGIQGDPAVDAGRNDFPDGLGSGSSARNPSNEVAAMRDPLRILADDTGGRALLNSNSIPDSIQQALDETSSYYLLAWRPDTEEQRSGRARLKVSIKHRPDLRVRLRRNYYVAPTANAKHEKQKERRAPASTSAKQTKELKPEVELLTALGALYPQRTLPTSLAIGYLNTPDQGLVLKLSMQIERSAFNFDSADSRKREIDVIGAAIDDRGVIVSFKQLLTIAPDSTAQKQGLPALWNQQLRVPAGLYQVRVATRERGSGRTGSAQQWIEVPNLSQGGLQLSSLFLAERQSSISEQATTAQRTLLVDVDHRFARSSVLRYQTYVYNAPRGNAGAPDVEVQARVLRDNRAVITMPTAKVPTATTTDNARLPYWAEVPLADLTPGSYLLQVTAIDRRTGASATQRTRFAVE